MKSKTPRTDGMTFGDQHGMMPPYNAVPATFARELEEENIAMRQAISAVAECIAGLDLHLQGNYGLFILMALDKLQPFTK